MERGGIRIDRTRHSAVEASLATYNHYLQHSLVPVLREDFSVVADLRL
jgi:hypothetical protein